MTTLDIDDRELLETIRTFRNKTSKKEKVYKDDWYY